MRTRRNPDPTVDSASPSLAERWAEGFIIASEIWLGELTAAARLVDNSELSVDLLEMVEDAVSQARGVSARLINAMDAGGLARSLGATSTGALLRDRLRLHPGDAYERVRIARRIAAATSDEPSDAKANAEAEPGEAAGDGGDDGIGPPDTGASAGPGDSGSGHATGRDLRDGLIRHEHAAVIVAAMGRLHESVGVGERAAMEAELLAKALTVGPKELAKIAQGKVIALNPQRDPPAEKERRDQRRLGLVERRDGLTEFHAVLDQLGAEIVRAAIDPLAAPCPGLGGLPDPRTASQRRADALVEGFDRLLTGGGLPTQQRVRPHVSVHVRIENLLTLGEDATDQRRDCCGPSGARSGSSDGAARGGHDSCGSAVTDLGRVPLPRALFERIACDAEVRRIVFGPRGEPLDVGRASRTPTAAIRAAVVARDRLCTHPGCDRPAGWSDVHHIRHWGRGRRGRTSVGNCALVCSYHHDLLHAEEGWEIRLGPTNRVEWRAPAHLDAGRRWRSNPIREAREPYGHRPATGVAA
jgi:Domain of unknown function (DUF222)